MRFLILTSALLVGCVAAPAPEANGYNVQLFFDGVPLGTETPVGTPANVIVKRIEQRMDQCTQANANASCDPIAQMPIALVSAKCDDVCTVTEIPATDGSVALAAVADRAGSTTLRVRVRSLVDGAEWEDGYPLAFSTSIIVRTPLYMPNVVDKKPSEK